MSPMGSLLQIRNVPDDARRALKARAAARLSATEQKALDTLIVPAQENFSLLKHAPLQDRGEYSGLAHAAHAHAITPDHTGPDQPVHGRWWLVTRSLTTGLRRRGGGQRHHPRASVVRHGRLFDRHLSAPREDHVWVCDLFVASSIRFQTNRVNGATRRSIC